jgi:hypothetical protein
MSEQLAVASLYGSFGNCMGRDAEAAPAVIGRYTRHFGLGPVELPARGPHTVHVAQAALQDSFTSTEAIEGEALCCRLRPDRTVS